MVPQKSGKADLENKRVLFFEIGLLIALLPVAAIFRYETRIPTPNPVFHSTSDAIAAQSEWTALASVEITSGTRSSSRPDLPVSDRIEIVRNSTPIAPREHLNIESNDYPENETGGDYAVPGYFGGSNKPDKETAITEPPDTKEKNTDYLFITFVPLPNPDLILDGIIIIPYTIGSRMDTTRLEQYTSMFESFLKFTLPVKYKPLIAELPLDFFAVEQQKIRPLSVAAKDRTAEDGYSVKNLLMSRVWVAHISGSDYCTLYLDYKNQTVRKTVIIGKQRFKDRLTRSFYLSDTIETHFDRNRIGRADNGRYIVSKTFSDMPEIVEILEINDSILVTRLLPGRLPIKYRAIRRKNCERVGRPAVFSGNGPESISVFFHFI